MTSEEEGLLCRRIHLDLFTQTRLAIITPASFILLLLLIPSSNS